MKKLQSVLDFFSKANVAENDWILAQALRFIYTNPRQAHMCDGLRFYWYCIDCNSFERLKLKVKMLTFNFSF